MISVELQNFLAEHAAFLEGPALFVKYGKGGSKSSDRYAKYSMEQEQLRQKKIKEATDTINNIFNNANRDSLYRQHRDAVYKLNTDEVNRQAQEAERANRFALARNGLLGGSVDVDSNAELDRRTNKGLLNASGIADDAAAKLRASDEATKQNLLQLAQTGISGSDVRSMANAQLANNINQGASDQAIAQVGQLFNDLANAYLFNNAAKQISGQNAALRGLYGQQNTGVSDTHSSYAGS